MNSTLVNQLEIWGFEGQALIFADGSLGYGLQYSGVDPSSWDAEKANAYAQAISTFLNGLPAGLSVQFFQEVDALNEETFKSHLKLSENTSNEAARSLAQERINRLRRLEEANSLPSFVNRIFMRKKPLKALLEKPKLFSKERLFNEISEDRLRQELTDLERLKDNLVQELKSLNLNPKLLGADEVAHLIYREWNPTRSLPLSSFDPEDIRGTILFSDVSVELGGFSIGTRQFKIASLKLLPDHTYSTMAAGLNGLPFKSRLVQSIYVPDQAKEIESLQTQRRIAYSMAVGKRNGVSDIESNEKFKDLEALLEDMIASGEKVFHVSTNVVLQADTEEELKDQVDLVLSKFRELGGAEAMEETVASFPIFRSLSIPNARCGERIKKIKTSNLADLVPLYSPWPGHAIPRVLFRSRSGGLLSIDPFDPSLSNANQLISGASGSGKSALTSILFAHMLKEDPKVFFVDLGGSYRKLTENLNGQYLSLGDDLAIALNPFDLNHGELTPSPQKIKFLVGLIELMTKEDEAQRLPRLIRTEIEKAIEKLYKKNPSPTLSDLKAALEAHEDVAVRNIGKTLHPWCGSSLYGSFLDRKTTISLDREIVAFDLKGLESYPDLQTVCLYIITDLVWRSVQSDPKRMKFLVFNECWNLLKDEAGRDFMEEVFRTFRKYNASAIAISHGIADFLQSKIASALLSTCSTKWILMQSQSEFQKLKDALGLNSTEIDLISSLRQKKGEFSEAFLMSGPDARTVAVVEPTPLELWIATTDARDIAKIAEYRGKFPALSTPEILKILSKEYPNGFAGQ